jgi:peptidoglycan/LPS O-acetylase OafA/YrhL
VISGFLITSIILRELGQGEFSVIRFYERRARRILPALFFVLACTLPFAWLWLLPDELERFGLSMAAVAGFVSNLYFWRTTDYFAPAAHEQPLLHTWSLAVEEQYYLLLPIFLLFCWRFGRSGLGWATAAIAVLSLALAEWGWRNDPTANYYLLPTRAWELLAGSLLASIAAQSAQRVRQSTSTAQWGSAAGLLAIVFSILTFDESTPFPSVYTLIPVIGTVLVIALASRDTLTGRLLATPPLVGIGLISYSAYLWHQPILVLSRNLYADPGIGLPILASTLSLLFAALSWRYVELPFRRLRSGHSAVFLASGTTLVLFAAVGMILYLQNGFESRGSALYRDLIGQISPYERERTRFDCIDKPELGLSATSCNIGDTTHAPPVLALVGDSHADQYAPIFSSYLRERSLSGIYFKHWWCPSIPKVRRSDPGAGGERCDAFNEWVFDTLAKDPNIRFVVISSRLNAYFGSVYDNGRNHLASDGPPVEFQFLAEPGAESAEASKMLDTLVSSGKVVIMMGRVPELPYNTFLPWKRAAFLNRSLDSPGYVQKTDLTNVAWQDIGRFLEELHVSQPDRLLLVHPEASLCPTGNCLLRADRFPIWSDDDHLNPLGARLVFERQIAPLLSPRLH